MNLNERCMALADARCSIWAITASALSLVDALLTSDLPLAKMRTEFDAGWRLAAAASARVPQGDRRVAVIRINGLISHRPNLLSAIFGGTATLSVSKQLTQALAAPEVTGILLDVDSPGGTVEGVIELADEIFAARRSGKKIVAVANAFCGSAAYWLASQASELCITPSGQAGSIGVISMHVDCSRALETEGIKVSLVSAGRYKTESNQLEPLRDEARRYMQSGVDHFYGEFVNAVARGRGVSVSAVRGGFGEGRMVSAHQAVADGMADRASTLDQEIKRLLTSGALRRSRSVALLKQEMRMWVN